MIVFENLVVKDCDVELLVNCVEGLPIGCRLPPTSALFLQCGTMEEYDMEMGATFSLKLESPFPLLSQFTIKSCYHQAVQLWVNRNCDYFRIDRVVVPTKGFLSNVFCKRLYDRMAKAYLLNIERCLSLMGTGVLHAECSTINMGFLVID